MYNKGGVPPPIVHDHLMYNNELYLIKTKENADRLKIVTINNVSTSEIISVLHQDVYGDGYSKTLGKYDFEEFFDFYMEVYFDDVFSLGIPVWAVIPACSFSDSDTD